MNIVKEAQNFWEFMILISNELLVIDFNIDSSPEMIAQYILS